jgi:ABC-type uncharacterized transport system involved in gliding motility auxiliary subunit
MNGGKTLWLVDQVNIEMDSLYNDQGASLAFPRDLNLNDLLFKYGVRINPVLVKDVMAAPIAWPPANKAAPHNTRNTRGFTRRSYIQRRKTRL